MQRPRGRKADGVRPTCPPNVKDRKKGDAVQFAKRYLPLADAVSGESFGGHCSGTKNKGGDGKEKNLDETVRISDD
jgi:hypothetical protein